MVLREEVKGTVKLKKRLKGKKGPTVLELTLGKLFCEKFHFAFLGPIWLYSLVKGQPTPTHHHRSKIRKLSL